MEFSIVPYAGNSPMQPWSSLADKAFFLKNNSRPDEVIFYYDSAPANGAASPPVIVFIHGLGDEADSWRHLIPLLSSRLNTDGDSAGCRVLALDLPGFGRSVAPSKISLKNHAAAVLRLIEAVVQPTESGGQKVFLAGNSMGAMVAEAAAIERPDLIHGLVLIDGSIPGGPANPGLLALAKLLLSRKWYRSYRENPNGAWGSLYLYYADLDSMPQEDKDFLRQRVMARVESETQERAFFATQRSLVWAFLTAASVFARKISAYKGKILLIWGEKDRIIPKSSTDAFMALRSDIEIKTIAGAGHLPQQERPEETARFIVQFVKSVNI